MPKVPLKIKERERRRKQASKKDESRIKKINTGFRVLHLVLSLCVENRKGEVTVLPAPSLYSSPDLFPCLRYKLLRMLGDSSSGLHGIFLGGKSCCMWHWSKYLLSVKKLYFLFEKLYVIMQNNILKYKYLKLNREMKYNMGIIFSTLSYKQGNIFKISKLIKMH